jgi:hypothetical protein
MFFKNYPRDGILFREKSLAVKFKIPSIEEFLIEYL